MTMPRTAKDPNKYRRTSSWIENRLMSLLPTSPELQQLVSDRAHGPTCAHPIGDPSKEKGKKGTWIGKMIILAKEMIPSPKSDEECWLVISKESTLEFKVGSEVNGGQKNYGTYIVLYALLKKTTRWLYPETRKSDQHNHTCSHGWKAAGKDGLICVNPFHIKIGRAKTNRDDEGCRYGALPLCPHDPKCVFLNPETGETLPCLNIATHVPICTHTPKCYPKVYVNM